MSELPAGELRWADAALVAALFALDPVGTGGVALRARAGPVRERWLELLTGLLPPSTRLRKVPLSITEGSLLGGLDLSATLSAGRPVAERGVLVEADGGIVLLAMAERLEPATAGLLSAVLDAGEVRMERDGFAVRTPTRFGVILLDEGIEDDERPPRALLDRLAFHLDLGEVAVRDAHVTARDPHELAQARAELGKVALAYEALAALTGAALALGIGSIRAPLLALRVARAAAALSGQSTVGEAEVALAARLVLAPRATRMPVSEPPEEAEQPKDAPPPEPSPEDQASPPPETDRPLEDCVLEAALAAIPPGLLARLQMQGRRTARGQAGGRANLYEPGKLRGRPAGTRRGEPRAGARLNVVETLRAAAPWQPLRRRETGTSGQQVQVRKSDFRVNRFKQRSQTTTLFVVDASGSQALNRLAEAKGAIELLLAESYVRRDQVALLAFRGERVELLLPPTRSLVRAKRTLAALPGGGGTPLATGIDAATTLAEALVRKGETPVVILMTDGRANVARDGSQGRAVAEEDALAAARRLRAVGITALLVDTSPRPQPKARALAEAMAAAYLPLPYADAGALSGAVRASAAA